MRVCARVPREVNIRAPMIYLFLQKEDHLRHLHQCDVHLRLYCVFSKNINGPNLSPLRHVYKSSNMSLARESSSSWMTWKD